MKFSIALAAVLLLGAGLRLYHLSSVPTELIVDEIDLYNSAHSIVTTGHDVDGTLLPFTASSFTRNPPIYAVASYASSLVFGKTPLGLRLPAVLFGLVAILLLYGIVFELTRRRGVALTAALLMATQPIFVHFSRIGWEPASELPFLLGGLYALLRALRSGAFGALAAAALLLALTAYTYMAGWFYALVLGGSLLALNARQLFRTRRDVAKAIAAAAIALLVAAPAIWMWFFDPLTAGRTQRIATFAHGVSPESLRVFALNYIAHLRWSYLVTTGDPHPATTWRYLNGFGAFFGWVVPLAALGLVSMATVRARWARIWIVVWLLAYPLGGALTNDGAPNAPRTLAGAPAFCILAAIGLRFLLGTIVTFTSRRSARRISAAAPMALAGLTAISVAIFARFYFTQYVHRNSNAWDSGTRAMFAAVIARSRDYNRVCFSIRPASYDVRSYIRFYLDGARIAPIDGVTVPACFLPGTLLVTDTDHPVRRAGFARVARIRDVDGNGFALLTARPRTREPSTR